MFCRSSLCNLATTAWIKAAIEFSVVGQHRIEFASEAVTAALNAACKDKT